MKIRETMINKPARLELLTFVLENFDEGELDRLLGFVITAADFHEICIILIKYRRISYDEIRMIQSYLFPSHIVTQTRKAEICLKFAIRRNRIHLLSEFDYRVSSDKWLKSRYRFRSKKRSDIVEMANSSQLISIKSINKSLINY